jgi:hypothetical protein
VSDEGDVFMWEGRSDYFPAEGRQSGSGSKKVGTGSGGKAGAIPAGIPPSHDGQGSSPQAQHVGSYGAAPAGGSYGSQPRRPGSFIERFGREREAAGFFGTSPTGAAVGFGSYGAAGSTGRQETGLGSGSRSSRPVDEFEKIRPYR